MINYYMPTKILGGKNIILEKAEEFKLLGKKALIVTGKISSKKNGSLNDVLKALEKCLIEYVLFDEIEENPSLETIDKATEIGRKNNIDFIIGIGGGSPIDASKVIGILIKNPDVPSEEIFMRKNLESINIAAVPTTSGTGTETTPYAIVTVHKEKTKKNFGQKVFPKVSFLDPSYSMNMPLAVTVSTAVDALSHLVEGYLNSNANILTDAIAESGLRLWGECIVELLAGELSFSTREKLMYASTIAGILIAQIGTSIPHGMGYPLTYYKGLPHGIANGVLYVEYLRSFKNRERVEKLPFLLGLESYQSMEDILRTFTKVDLKLSHEEIHEFSKSIAENKAKLQNHPESITYEELYEIYKNSL